MQLFHSAMSYIIFLFLISSIYQSSGWSFHYNKRFVSNGLRNVVSVPAPPVIFPRMNEASNIDSAVSLTTFKFWFFLDVLWPLQIFQQINDSRDCELRVFKATLLPDYWASVFFPVWRIYFANSARKRLTFGGRIFFVWMKAWNSNAGSNLKLNVRWISLCGF